MFNKKLKARISQLEQKQAELYEKVDQLETIIDEQEASLKELSNCFAQILTSASYNCELETESETLH